MTAPDADTIVRAARVALGDFDAEIPSWQRTPIQWQAIAPTTAELARYRGTTADGRQWSAINKIIRQADSRWNSDWRREADVYVSGCLAGLPPGITAPRVYMVVDTPGESSLWLEDVVETVPVWPLSRYAVAARDLGRFNGAYLAGRSVPERPPLVTGWLEGWVKMTGERAPEFLDDPAVTGHELVRRAVPDAWLDRKFDMTLEDAAGPFGEFIGFALDRADEALAAAAA